MICPAREIIKLRDPFPTEASGSNIVRFVSVLAKRLRNPPTVPFGVPSTENWLVKIVAIEGRFVLGLYRREMKAISYLVKVEEEIGIPVNTRNWKKNENGVKN